MKTQGFMEWIKTSDRLPETYDDILLVVDGSNDIHVGYFILDEHEGNCFHSLGEDLFFKIEDVTHWMELPEPPKGE
ncbi:DUF551 domain-containing protein [Xenorhabdus bovienii]|uniref:Uncharacterized 7.8 kDa protein in ral-gp17 intergenic region n=1 Tax=Xenorhabdus bovienii str. kraussei Becker Underwood TaxID=1398204 RepID=A0A077PWU4_XENBV|nr:DUF551 domain-containing protein [Xenorhabdus bovienii]CDH25152.1 Uncharacterized 7.8 kDa protein in ral-gp17 intergenic region [Xenorhabdus bovienii str. kraussei Becker Underwood]